jgi:hypothetical protein
MDITGTADGPPVRAGVAVTDYLAGLYAFSGILLALRTNTDRVRNRAANGRPLCPRCRAPLWSVRVQLEDTADDKRMFQCPRCEHSHWSFNQQPSAMLSGIADAHRSPTINNPKIKG